VSGQIARKIAAAALLVACAILLLSRITLASEPYFPPHVFDLAAHRYKPKTYKLDDPAVTVGRLFSYWYSRQLAALGEKPLAQYAAPQPVYRFTWLRSFDKPMTFRWTIKPTGPSMLIVKRGTRQVELRAWSYQRIYGGSADRALIELQSNWREFRRKLYWSGMELEKTIELDTATTSALLRRLDGMGFWDLPTTQSDQMGLDGAQWLLEGEEDGRYHAVDRWSGGDIAGWALALMRASGVDLGRIY
jgi:hypothetical protein